MNGFEKLIGAQIIRIDEDSIQVKLDGVLHTLTLDTDHGDCCGYAEFRTQMLYSENDVRNPVITNIEIENNEGEYSSEVSILTFYGESKELAAIESEAGSGSGWHYGATVSIRCESLNISEYLASW